MEFEVKTAGGMESCFVSLPLPLIQTLNSSYLPPILAIELRSDSHVWHVAWCGSASSSASVIEVAAQYADSIGLSDGSVVKVRVISNVPKATLVTIEPLTEDDWEILELNSEVAESAILKQVGVVYEQMAFPLWLHGQTVVTFRVVSVFPQKSVVLLVPGTEVAVAPKKRKESYMNSKAVANAQLRVQDLDVSFIDHYEQKGFKMDILFTSGILIHPETAKKYSLDAHQFVSISPKLCSKDSKSSKTVSDYLTDKKDSSTLMVCLFLSELVARGHVMISQGLRLFLGSRLHSWVHVKGHSVIMKGDITDVSISPHNFRILQNSSIQIASLDEKNSHERTKENNVPKDTSLSTVIGITDWLVHEKLIASLASSSFHGRTEGTTMLAGKECSKAGCQCCLAFLLRAWCSAQLRIFTSNSFENVNTLLLGRKTLLHMKVKNQRLPGYRRTSSEMHLENKNQMDESTVDLFYILSLSWESLDGADDFAYELSFDNLVGANNSPKTLDILVGKLQLGDLLSSVTPYEMLAFDGLGSTISSLDWMGNAPLDINYRLRALLSPSSGILSSSHNLPLPGHALICGPSGSGKTLLAKVSARSIEECKDILAHVVFVSCSRVSLERPQTAQQTLSGYFSEALDFAPSVIILDDLDSLIAPASDLEGSQPSISSTALTEFIADLLDEYSENARSSCGIGPIAFVATAQSLTSLPQSLRSSGRFDFHVNLPAPAAAERSGILKHEIQKRSLRCSEELLSEIASKCDGYDAYDLEILVDRSVHAAIGRSLSTQPGTGENENPALVKNDFLHAMLNFLPVAMRDLTKPGTVAARSGWEDVGGLKDIQRGIKEMIELPSKFRAIFAQAPLRMRSNILLYGPPGCGKTHIVGAAAAACSLRFISVKGPELLNKYIGASEHAVRDIFSKAAAAAPCILFFDEFDSIAPKRGHDNTGVTDRVVNQFLTELDGVEVLTGVFVFAATSRPDLLDAALLRPGRLDRLLFCDFPSQQERLDILQVLSRKLPMATDVDLEGISHMTEGFSGADLEALLSDAQLEAVHEVLDSHNKKPVIISNDLLISVASKAKPSVSESEKRRLYSIYSQFLDSKRSLASQSREAKGKRATLA